MPLPGERNPAAKLCERDVLEIRGATGTLKEIGDRYGVHLSTVWLIRRRLKWAHVQEVAS